jgi:hypothetical protein
VDIEEWFDKGNSALCVGHSPSSEVLYCVRCASGCGSSRVLWLQDISGLMLFRAGIVNSVPKILSSVHGPGRLF